MNVNTGDLYRVKSEEELEQIKGLFGEAIQPVPKNHSKEANAELGDKDHTVVDMSKNTPLTNWAKKKNNKNRRKMAKASKKRNR